MANNGTGTSTAYTANGNSLGYTVKIPGADGINGHGNPTGIVANNTSGFVVTKNAQSGPPEYMFVNEDGVISGWSPTIDFNNAIMAVPATGGAVYKGVTMGVADGQSRLYAADFHNGVINVFDSTFAKVTLTNGFVDSKLPAGDRPFNISNVGGKLYVAYAQQDSAHEDEVGNGKGFVDVFDTKGVLLQRLQKGKFLNAPWAVTRRGAKEFWKPEQGHPGREFRIGKDRRVQCQDGKIRGLHDQSQRPGRRDQRIVGPGFWPRCEIGQQQDALFRGRKWREPPRGFWNTYRKEGSADALDQQLKQRRGRDVLMAGGTD